VLRRTQLDLAGLYRKEGPYWYAGGFNPWALVALIVGIALCIPGFLATLGVVALVGDTAAAAKVLRVPNFFGSLYSYAWFTSFGAAFFVYLAAMFTVGQRGNGAASS
jgi:nucleobase:cation symporter-1, NCS1 family